MVQFWIIMLLQILASLNESFFFLKIDLQSYCKSRPILLLLGTNSDWLTLFFF